MVTISSHHKIMVCNTFQIAEIVLNLMSEQKIRITKPFFEFVTDCEKQYQIQVETTDSIETLGKKVIYTSDIFHVTDAPVEERVFYKDTTQGRQAYAVGTYDYEDKTIRIKYLKEHEENFSETGNTFFHIGWETILLHEDRLILHSCFVDTKFGGILFSGNSGIGKSSQGNLWTRYEEAEVINGDRTILYKKKDGWYGYGSPYAGSSRIYKNQSSKICAVIMLAQSSENKIRRLSKIQAFQKVFAQMTVNSWNRSYVSKTMDLVETFIQDIPVYELSCTPDQRAVETLKAIMKQGGEA